jgi:anti-anti-sigma factor
VEISVSKDQDAVIVSVEGRMDTLSSPGFQKQMEELLVQEPQRLVLDFARLEYVSSAGLRSILIIAKKVQNQGGKVICCALQPMVQKVFDVSGFTRVIPIFDSVNEAIGGIG